MPLRPAPAVSTYAMRAAARRHAARVQAVRHMASLALWCCVPLASVGLVASVVLPKVQALAAALSVLP